MPDSSRYSPRRRWPLLALWLLGGCATLDYYGQAVHGHLDLLLRSRPIDTVIHDSSVSPKLRQRLRRALEARDFAVRELGLPDNNSYRRYADLGRPYAVWNVFAAPELSLQPEQWCFALVGCVNYRGYFDPQQAVREASALHARGFDVYIGGVAAYSTLGASDDPLLNTMLRRGETETIAVIFHELAHQRIYVRGDTPFNESFAVTVEQEGIRRWLAGHGQEKEQERYRLDQQRRQEFTALLLRTRERLDRLYRSPASDDDKRAGKTRLFNELRREYIVLRSRWGGDPRYDRWMSTGLNNAKLAAVGTYHRHTAAFRRLLAERQGNFSLFYDDVRKLAALSRPDREARLRALAARAR